MPSPPVLPMTLGNMRELGIRSLAVTCELCHHEATLVLVRAFRSRMDVRPAEPSVPTPGRTAGGVGEREVAEVRK